LFRTYQSGKNYLDMTFAIAEVKYSPLTRPPRASEPFFARNPFHAISGSRWRAGAQSTQRLFFKHFSAASLPA
jgi:hypothetical protein